MIKNNYPGKFIVIEGLDGSGQSTQVSLLRDFFIAQNIPVITTKEPTLTSEAGKRIKEKILTHKEKVSPEELQKLFAQDRKEHLEDLIIPALEQGKIVISDRYFFSSFAYGVSEELDLDWLINLNNEFLIPDLTIVLKVDPKVCISRIEGRGSEREYFEKEEKLAKVWETYAILPGRIEDVNIIDGEETIEQVSEKIKGLVNL